MGNLIALLHRTMVLERLTGVIAYAAVVLISFSYLQKVRSERQIRNTLFVVILLLGIMAYFYIPGMSADLYRWREIILHWDTYSFSYFFNTYLHHSSTPSAYLIMYFTRKTGLNGLLPMLVCVAYFAAIFYIVFSEYKRGQASAFAVAQVYFFFMAAGSFLEVISGIRCFLALSVVAWCIYTETAGSRSMIRNAILYIVACTLHLSAIPVVCLRIAYLLICNINKKGINIGNIILVFLFTAGGLVFGREYIEAAIEKGSVYLTNEMYHNLWEYIIGALSLLIIIVTLAEYRAIRTDPRYARLEKLAGFCRLMAVVEACFCFEYSIFHRFVMFNSILILPVMCSVIDSKIEKKASGYINMLRLLSLAILAIACTRGNLCGYKFFLLT